MFIFPSKFKNSNATFWLIFKHYVIGGHSSPSGYKRDTYIIDIVKNTLSNGPSLLKGRQAHGCEKLNVNGESFIIIPVVLVQEQDNQLRLFLLQTTEISGRPIHRFADASADVSADAIGRWYHRFFPNHRPMDFT